MQPTGMVLPRAAFLAWLTDAGYGSKATAGAPASPGGGGGGGGGGARARMWADRWSERELAPGVWLARYMELHQPFAGEAVVMQIGGCRIMLHAHTTSAAPTRECWQLAPRCAA